MDYDRVVGIVVSVVVCRLDRLFRMLQRKYPVVTNVKM